VPLTVERIADTTAELFRQLVAWWGGGAGRPAGGAGPITRYCFHGCWRGAFYAVQSPRQGGRGFRAHPGTQLPAALPPPAPPGDICRQSTAREDQGPGDRPGCRAAGWQQPHIRNNDATEMREAGGSAFLRDRKRDRKTEKRGICDFNKR